MALFGSSWDEEDREVGPLSHWLEDEDQNEMEEADFSLFSRWKEKPSVSIDRKGRKCICRKGVFKETTQLDDLKGVLHCSHCDKEVARYT